jgi:hypothetical protein
MRHPPMHQSILIKLIQAEKRVKELEQRIKELEEIISEHENQKQNIVCDSLESEDIINDFNENMKFKILFESYDLLEN